MKIAVPIKRVVDGKAKIGVRADGQGIRLAGVKTALKHFD